MVSFKVSKADGQIIQAIAERAFRVLRRAGADVEYRDCLMDITAVHANGMPLNLPELAGADDFNFAHDISGIWNHLDRSTGTLRDCFVPRFAAKY